MCKCHEHLFSSPQYDKENMGHVYHCVASPLLLLAVCKHLGTVETSFWTFGRGQCCPFLV